MALLSQSSLLTNLVSFNSSLLLIVSPVEQGEAHY